MAKSIPTTLDLPETEDHEPDLDVDLDLLEIVEALHYTYQRSGAHSPGHTFNPPLERDSDVLSIVDAAGGRVFLDTWGGLIVFQRRIYDAPGTAAHGYRLRLDAFMRNAQLEITVVRFNGDGGGNYTTFGTLTAIAAGTNSQWVSDTLDFTIADAHEAGLVVNPLAVFYLYARVRANNFAGDGIGYLYQWGVREDHRIPGTDLPRAPA